MYNEDRMSNAFNNQIPRVVSAVIETGEGVGGEDRHIIFSRCLAMEGRREVRPAE